MNYDPQHIIQSYTENAELEDQSEKKPSLRTEIPREFIKRYIRPSDITLDAGGGVGVNAIMMAELCQSVTLLDITPKILELARKNIADSGHETIKVLRGDICNLSQFEDGEFSFIVCVGDALSYVLDAREKAISELIRVAQSGSILILGTDSKYGFLRLRLAEGKIKEAREILITNTTYCGMGPKSHLYTVEEMLSILERNGCQLLEVASTPSLSDTIDVTSFRDTKHWDRLKELELKICTIQELLGVGLHLLFIAQKD
ncbi:MAG: class I SAM-dependent methyltransferase [Anaerolineales bacterium]